MPLCSLHLVRLRRGNDKTSAQSVRAPEAAAAIHNARQKFLQRIVNSGDLDARLLVACVVRRPVIVSNRIDPAYLNATPWDLLLIFKGTAGAAATSSSGAGRGSLGTEQLALEHHIDTRRDVSAEYSVQVGIPSRILDNYGKRSGELRKEATEAAQGRSQEVASTSALSDEVLNKDPARSVGTYAPKTSQNLEMSPDLLDLIAELEQLRDSDGLVDALGPVQQLNLLSFKKTKEDKERYYKYGEGFGPIARTFGGEPKILGSVVDPSQEAQQRRQHQVWWDEVSLVNYHSIRHFAGMAASKEYQDINRTYRLPSLDDTTIICTQEVDMDAFRKRYRVPLENARL